jgi:restriction endonuclease S subunit
MQKIKIGIFGLTQEISDKKLKEVASEFDDDLIKSSKKDRVIFKDGGEITSYGISTNIRGVRRNLIYVDKRLKDTDIFKEVIAPTISSKKYYDKQGKIIFDVMNSEWDCRYCIRWF